MMSFQLSGTSSDSKYGLAGHLHVYVTKCSKIQYGHTYMYSTCPHTYKLTMVYTYMYMYIHFQFPLFPLVPFQISHTPRQPQVSTRCLQTKVWCPTILLATLPIHVFACSTLQLKPHIVSRNAETPLCRQSLCMACTQQTSGQYTCTCTCTHKNMHLCHVLNC